MTNDLRIAWSQNFLADRKTVRKTIGSSGSHKQVSSVVEG